MAASAQVLKVRCKHRVIFREAKQGRIVDTSVGELYSFYDDITGSFLAEKDNLVVEGYEKPENLPGLSSSTTKVHFYFGVSESETNKELLKFLNFLRQNTKYVGKIRFDESAGYLRAFPPAGEAADIGGFRKGFKCTIYKDMRSMHEWVRSKVREIMKVNSDVNLRANVPSAVTLPPPPSPTQLPPVPEKKLRRGVSINIENNQEILIESRYAEKDKNEVHSLSQVQMDERGINKDDSGAAAKEHYNKTVRNKALRHHSNMYHLRNINNFVKGMVIEEASDIIAKRSKHLAVLDLACGKGGDMLKWIHNKRIAVSAYVGADIAETSLSSFVQDRLLDCSPEDRMKVRKLISANLSTDSLSSSLLRVLSLEQGDLQKWTEQIPLSKNDTFDIISCQFAMHYMFRSKVTTNNLLSEISRHLKDHGLYIATTMDCRTLAHYVRKALHGPYPGQEDQGPETIPGFSSTIEDEQVKILIKNEFDQALLSIRLSIDMANKLLVRSTDTSEEDGLGIEYHFSLFDSEIEAAVDVPEYLVPLGKSFKNMLTENGLKVYKIQNFHEYVNEKLCSASNLPIAEKMKIWNFSGSISTAEWAIMRLYNVVMLQKDGITHTSHTQDISTPLPPFESNTNSPPSSPPLFMPCSPIYRYFVPATPEWIIPEEEFLLEDDVMDPTILALQKRADLAKQLCGGEEIWDALDEDEVEKWMEIAKSEEKMELHRDGTLPHPSNKRKLLSNSQEATEEETPEQEFKRRKQ